MPHPSSLPLVRGLCDGLRRKTTLASDLTRFHRLGCFGTLRRIRTACPSCPFYPSCGNTYLTVSSWSNVVGCHTRFTFDSISNVLTQLDAEWSESNHSIASVSLCDVTAPPYASAPLSTCSVLIGM